MKIIGVCNFNKETINDFLVCENVSEHYGNKIVEMLNVDNGERGPTFFRLVPDEHVLYVWEP